MNCPYCRTLNEAAERRCARCGRRLHPAGTSGAGFGSGPAQATATAFALDHSASLEQAKVEREKVPAQAPLAEPTPASTEAQPWLFRETSTGGPKVVPIPTLAPMRPASPLDRESVRRNAARSAARVTRPVTGSQQKLDLQGKPQEQVFRQETNCDARVAVPTHRAIAAAVDGAYVLAGTSLFLTLAYASGVDFTTLPSIFLIPVAMAAVVMILYRGLWCLANEDTPGMRFAGLRLVDFDGRTPRRERRIVRQFAGMLSLLSAGVGLVWALVDEESLTWHDHISKTFPTTT